VTTGASGTRDDFLRGRRVSTRHNIGLQAVQKMSREGCTWWTSFASVAVEFPASSQRQGQKFSRLTSYLACRSRSGYFGSAAVRCEADFSQGCAVFFCNNRSVFALGSRLIPQLLSLQLGQGLVTCPQNPKSDSYMDRLTPCYFLNGFCHLVPVRVGPELSTVLPADLASFLKGYKVN
jgi:hypothetical protein